MDKIPSASLDAINEIVDSLFNRMAFRLLGNIPQLADKKVAIFSSETYSNLPNLFVQSLGMRSPNKPEGDILKNLLSTTHSYIEALKHKTKARLAEELGSNSYTKEEAGAKVNEVLASAGKHFKLIAESEATKTRNLAKASKIAKVSADMGVDDPLIYFVLVRDERTCEWCVQNHTVGGVTPKVFKLSTVKITYLTKGEKEAGRVSVSGQHPNCFTEDMMLHTSKGLVSLGDMYLSQEKRDVVVDSRIKNRKSPTNQYGKEIEGSPILDRHSGEGATVKKASPVYYTGEQECLRITLGSGQSVEVSKGHEMWVDDGLSGVKVRAESLAVGDKIPVLQSNEGFYGDESFPELAELMGNLMGDGYLGKKACTWNFFGNDIPYGRKLFEIAKPYGVKAKTSLVVRGPDRKYSVDWARFSNYQLRKIFVEDFDLSKAPRRIPKRLWGADKATVSSFLRGLYSADGHSESGGLSITQNDLGFLKDIQLLLSMCGYSSRIHSHDKAGTKSIKYSDERVFETNRKETWRLLIGDLDQRERFSKEIGFGVESKQSRLEKHIKDQRLAGEKTRFGWRTARVTKIEALGIRKTYCLTEPGTNTVTVNGIVTGQCRCTMSFLAPGYGFNSNGHIKYIAPGHDERAKQNPSTP